jgi:hypothetical protein
VTEKGLANCCLFAGTVTWALMEYVIGYNTLGSLVTVGTLVAGIGIYLFKWIV